MFSAKDPEHDDELRPAGTVRQVWTVVSGRRSRQVVTCAAAAAQVLLPTLAGPSFDRDDGPLNVIQPAPYTFSVWFPIFAWSLGYAGYQARGSARDRELLDRVGWPLVGAFTATGVWAPLARTGRYWSAQAALVAIAAFAEVARRRVGEAESQRELDPGATGATSRADLVAAAPTAAMLAAWGLAATGVNLASMLVSNRLVAKGRPAALTGAALLLGLGAQGARVARDASTSSARIYVATLLWGLTGVVVGQRKSSPSAAGAAVGAASIILTSLQLNRARRLRGQASAK